MKRIWKYIYICWSMTNKLVLLLFRLLAIKHGEAEGWFRCDWTYLFNYKMCTSEMQICWVNCCSPASCIQFCSLTCTSVGYFGCVGNWLKFWPLNSVWPTAALKQQTNLPNMTHTGSATYTAFQEAQMLSYNTLSLLLLPPHFPSSVHFFLLMFILKI